MEQRIAWENLPGQLKEAIAARTGPITGARAMTAGQNSPLAAVVDTAEGRVFVKGLPSGHRKVMTQDREAAVAPLVTAISPAMLWHFDDAGWNVLGYQYAPGRHADYRTGSPDLDQLVQLMTILNGIEAPADPGPLKRAEDRWKPYVEDPGDAVVFTGHTLTHTDWAPDNVLIAPGRAWLIDWAWPTIGAAWIDPACWLLRLMAAGGHTPAEAERQAARLPPFADADSAHIALFARASARLWEEIARANRSAWTRRMAQSAHDWAAHRQASLLRQRACRPNRTEPDCCSDCDVRPCPREHNSPMRGYVGVTDGDWYRFLADRPQDLGEVNFWRPGGGRGFHAVAEGEPFFFKTHAPDNRVVGGGFFGGFAPLRVSEAWDLLGPANGVASQEAMTRRIAHYRREPIAPGEDPEIGCVFVRDVTFFPDDLTFEPPPEFSSNIVQGKSYEMGDARYSRYFGDLMQLVLGVAVEFDLSRPWHRSGPVFGDPRLAPYRLGQQAFKAVVADAYQWRCAITGSKIRPALQAAHILPVKPTHGGENRLDNGLLLRSDVHVMFDHGYVGVDPSYRLRVSPRLRSEFGNGDSFYARAGEVITLPERRADRPNPDFLQWHLDTVFKAA